MRRVVLLAALAGLPLIQQTNAQQTSPTGFGRQIYPGTGGPNAPVRGTLSGGTGGGGFGRMIYPGTGAPAIYRGGGAFAGPPTIGHPNHSRGGVVAYPVFYGGGYYDGIQAPPAATPYSDYDLDYPSQRPPVVIINQNFRPDVAIPGANLEPEPEPEPGPAARTRPAPNARPERAPATPVNEEEATIYLIAMKDSSIFATVGYWVEGDTLNYLTREGSHNRASLALVDRELTQRLNDERNVEFKLPKR
jgi:hypothetical protein